MIEVAIIEDVEAIRKSITAYLDAQEEFAVTASSNSVEAFLALDPAEIKPDVILSDIGLPGMNGIEGIRLFQKKFPDAEIIMLTVFQDEEHIFKALCAGATGYLLKSTPLPRIRESILDITVGEVPMSKAVARKVLEHFKPNRTYGVKMDELTAREKQVLQNMVEGLSYKMIAARLDTSLETVRTQVKSIYKKLHVNSKAEAIRIAMHNKM
ncbi:MAG TPA: response regulator transcription factor [Chitinophagaceae bacterium]|nr:response regulator transcription factor [Chitinophagaceae bacterium]HPH30508.1 response regulator transcription factor [Chitinophagaceae bacterium]HPN57969.1 response regulator transcription factor [Chitinophagaceae bacterium]